MEIGKKIKQLRCQAGLTQEQLASRLGISSQSVSKWETALTMPDIMLLPTLAGELGVTVDELFDLTVDQKLRRIDKKLDVEEELSADVFKEYEAFLLQQLEENKDRTRVLGLLAHLYHHRADADLRRSARYAKESILRSPERKECQYLLQKAEGATVWDWNVSNHTQVIDFYKDVIQSDNEEPKTPMPYYELMDNLIADHRTEEAREYLEIYRTLPAHKPHLLPIYEAYIALAEYNVQRADAIMEEAMDSFGENGGFLFEAAQYHARKCDYEQAIAYYERSWAADEAQKPRYTDPLEGMAVIYGILGDTERALKTYDRMIDCIKNEWGYSEGDAAVVEVERKKQKLISRSRGAISRQ